MDSNFSVAIQNAEGVQFTDKHRKHPSAQAFCAKLGYVQNRQLLVDARNMAVVSKLFSTTSYLSSGLITDFKSKIKSYVLKLNQGIVIRDGNSTVKPVCSKAKRGQP